MKDKIVYLSGFTPEENSLIKSYLSTIEFRVVPIDGEPVEYLKAVGEAHIVFTGIHNKEDVSRLRNILVDTPNHLIGCAISPEKRNLLFSISVLQSPAVFFLPLDENEVKKTAVKLDGVLSSQKIKRNVSGGIKTMSQVSEWETGGIEVSEICRQTAGKLREAGYFLDGIEEEHAVLALEEALINAVEHGNLEIDSSLRPENLLDEDKYEILKEQRLKDPVFSKRIIRITIKTKGNTARVKIKNEGPGFDASGYLSMTDSTEETSREKIMKVSGKGLHLIKNSFNKVLYNEKGTEMILEKHVDKMSRAKDKNQSQRDG